MITVGCISDYLNELAPLNLSEDWDNTGLLIGERSRSVENALTCLTVTEAVVAEAIQGRADLIVSHHPLLFRGVQSITDTTSEGRMLLQLISKGIAVYSPHTAFDSCRNGINQQLAQSFELKNIRSLRSYDDAAHPGAGRRGELASPIKLSEFMSEIRNATSAKYLEFCGREDSLVRNVAVACGSAAEFLIDAAGYGCDTFVTGEARFHSVLEAQALGLNMILTGHFESERPAVEWLATELGDRFPEVKVAASVKDENPLRLFQE